MLITGWGLLLRLIQLAERGGFKCARIYWPPKTQPDAFTPENTPYFGAKTPDVIAEYLNGDKVLKQGYIRAILRNRNRRRQLRRVRPFSKVRKLPTKHPIRQVEKIGGNRRFFLVSWGVEVFPLCSYLNRQTTPIFNPYRERKRKIK